MPETKHPLKVFLCHAHSDAIAVRALYNRLTRDGVDAWLDKERLLPGQDWELEIRKAVRESDVVVVCLSKQFNQAGFRQKEVRLALDTAMEQPEGEIFIIPARLEECDTLESLRKWHWVDLFDENGYENLMRALRRRAEKIGVQLKSAKNKVTKNVIAGNKKNNLSEVEKTTITNPRRKFEILLALIGVVVLVIMLISFVWPSLLNVSISLTPTVTFTPSTSFVCPPQIITTPPVSNHFPPGKLIIVLIEDTPEYRFNTLQAVEIMENVLARTIQPGDYVLMLSMGSTSLENAVFVKQKADSVFLPAIASTPTLFPTLTPTLLPSTTPQTRIGQMGATFEAESTAVSINATGTYTTLLHECAVNTWQEQYQAQEITFNETKMQIAQKFMFDWAEQAAVVNDLESVPEIALWQGLSYVTVLLENECKEYYRCVVFVFSSMIENSEEKPADLIINVEESEFIGVMLECKFLYTGSCGEWRRFWQDNLKASLVDFINGDNVVDTLIEFLSK